MTVDNLALIEEGRHTGRREPLVKALGPPAVIGLREVMTGQVRATRVWFAPHELIWDMITFTIRRAA